MCLLEIIICLTKKTERQKERQNERKGEKMKERKKERKPNVTGALKDNEKHTLKPWLLNAIFIGEFCERMLHCFFSIIVQLSTK